MATPSRPRSSATSDAAGFARIRVLARDAGEAERLAAEAFEAGAGGLEERNEEGGIALLVYAPAPRAREVADAMRAAAGDPARVGAPEAVEPEAWALRWQRAHEPIELSPRLRIRPSFAAPARASGQSELVIDPGQAFGTGAHASSRLALEGVDALAPGLAAGDVILDVGCGSGVLALAALRLSIGTRALALDLDPEAASATRANATLNGLAARLDVLLGPLDALRPRPFALVVANLLRSEMQPLLGALAACVAPGGRAVLSGLLVSERQRIEAALAAVGLRVRGERRCDDPAGDVWLSLVTSH